VGRRRRLWLHGLVLEQGLVSRSATDWMDTRYRGYLAGRVSEVEICGEMVQLYAGLRDEELRAAAARYVSEFVRPRIFAEMAQLVATLGQAGVALWAVSSTNKWVVAEGVRDFGIPAERVLAAEVRVVDGLITSELVDVPTDAAKAVSLKRVGLAPRCGLRQLRPRSGDAGAGALRLPGQPLAGADRAAAKERLGLLPACGGRGRRRRPWVANPPFPGKNPLGRRIKPVFVPPSRAMRGSTLQPF
jgi:phosphoserine phosphatase